SDSASAFSALTKVDGLKVTLADLSSGYLLTRLTVQLAPSATIAQFNAAANAVGATAIDSSDPDSSLLSLAVPRQSNVAALWQLARQLAQQPGIAFAAPGRQAKVSVLPKSTSGPPVPPAQLAHLLGNRFPQAWNARQAAPADCLPRVVDVYVWDQFG